MSDKYEKESLMTFISSKPSIPATNGLRKCATGIIYFMGIILSTVPIAGLIMHSQVKLCVVTEVIIIIISVIPKLMQIKIEKSKDSNNKVDSSQWLIVTLLCILVGVDAALINSLPLMISDLSDISFIYIVVISASLVIFILGILWSRHRIISNGGNLETIADKVAAPTFVAPLFIALLSTLSRGKIVGLTICVTLFINTIIEVGLSQTLMKLKLAKEYHLEQYLPKYKL